MLTHSPLKQDHSKAVSRPRARVARASTPDPDDDDHGPRLQMVAASDIMSIEYDDSAGLQGSQK